MSRRRKYASGRKSYGICQRSGFKVPYKYIVREPGTGLLVDKRMSDGMWNIVDHPQNFSPKDLSDSQILRNATGDENFEFANCDLVRAKLLDENGNDLLNRATGQKLTNIFTKLHFNSFKKV